MDLIRFVVDVHHHAHTVCVNRVQAFQNNHAPYTAVEQYTNRYPAIKTGSMKSVCKSLN